MQPDPETQPDLPADTPEETAFDQFLAAALMASREKERLATPLNLTPEMAAYLRQRTAELLADLKARFPKSAQ